MEQSSKTTLQHLIKAQGYTQKDIAKALGIKVYKLTRMLQDQDSMPIGTLKAIVRIIGLKLTISVDYIL